MVLPLFQDYPRLADRLPHVALADLPTPVEHWEGFGAALGVEVWAKRDDHTADPYGGNKVRKLEFALGAAQERGSGTTITMGYAGSNHCVATAVHGSRLGMHPVSMLLRERPKAGTTEKLLAQVAAGAELHLIETRRELQRALVSRFAEAARHDRRRPTYLPAGASSSLGTVGYVNAGFELARQIDAGALPEPARVYVPVSTAGTVAGLLLGLRAAGVTSPIHGVRVIDDSVANPKELYKRLAFTLALLRRSDDSFPHVKFDAERLYLREDQYGAGYGKPTEASMEVADLLGNTEGHAVDGTYSAKALAAVLADARAGDIDGPILFWCTYDSRPLTHLTHGLTADDLPSEFRDYADAVPVG